MVVKCTRGRVQYSCSTPATQPATSHEQPGCAPSSSLSFRWGLHVSPKFLEMRILQSLQISKRISRNSCVAQHPDRQKRDRQAASIFAYCQLPLATAVSAAPQLSVTALIVCEFRLCFAPCAGPKPPINHYSIIRRRCDRGNPQIKFPRGHIGVWSHRGDFLKYENRNIVFQNFKFPTSVDRRMFESLNVRRSYFRTSKNARVAADRERQYFSASKRARTVSHGFAAQLPPQA